MTAHWLPLDHPASTRADDVGHKCANLAQARNKGFAIPLAVVIPVQDHADRAAESRREAPKAGQSSFPAHSTTPATRCALLCIPNAFRLY